MQLGYTYGNSMLLNNTYRSSRIPRQKPLQISMLRTGAQKATSISKNLMSKIPWDGTKRVGAKMGKYGLVGGGIAAAGLAVASGISSYAQSLRRPPVVHTGRLRSTGQTNQYHNLGADTFAGVRFAGRKRNFMM